MNMKVIHNINPIYDKNSKILILGSMPSITSREEKFFYAHKQNRFWPVINILFNQNLISIEEKEEFLLKNNIAVWDTIKSCDIVGSSDSSIKNIEVNDINSLIRKTKVHHIFCMGKISYNTFIKNVNTAIPVTCLPSSSSANANKTLQDLVKDYKIILEELNSDGATKDM